MHVRQLYLIVVVLPTNLSEVAVLIVKIGLTLYEAKQKVRVEVFLTLLGVLRSAPPHSP